MPGLIAASVWMIPLIIRPFLALSERSRLLTIPEVSVRSRPNGLPRARIFWPTITVEESPRFERKELVGRHSDQEHGHVVRRIGADDPGLVRRAVEERDPDRDPAGIVFLDDVKIGQDVALLVDDEPRAGAGRGLVAEEAGHLGLGRDVDDALVGRGVDADVVPLVGIEVLEHIFRMRRSRILNIRRGRRRVRRSERLGPGRGLRAKAARNLGQRGQPRKPSWSPKKIMASVSVKSAVAMCDRTGRPNEVIAPSFITAPSP